eukprot:1302511-Amphidinium_carterae.3
MTTVSPFTLTGNSDSSDVHRTPRGISSTESGKHPWQQGGVNVIRRIRFVLLPLGQGCRFPHITIRDLYFITGPFWSWLLV